MRCWAYFSRLSVFFFFFFLQINYIMCRSLKEDIEIKPLYILDFS